MNQNTADSETILRGVLDGWKVAVDKHQTDTSGVPRMCRSWGSRAQDHPSVEQG
ncbi:hypothetical protein [Planotetraspora mira]|uniref:hypothetical protein n=1 Tax=Planotetraspora mira TaxID=58121 RepID=UPI00366FDFF4